MWERWQNSYPQKKKNNGPCPPGCGLASTWLVPYALHQKEMPPCTLGSSHRTLKDPEEAEWGPLCEQKGRTANLVEGTGNFRCCFWKDLQGQNHLSSARSLTHTHTHSLSLPLFFLTERFFTGGRGSGAPNKTHPIACRCIRSLVVTDVTKNIRIQPGGT